MRYNGPINNIVGEKVYGYCEGAFGRNSYEDKVIIMNGWNWVVALPNYGLPEIAYFDDNKELRGWLDKNSTASKNN